MHLISVPAFTDNYIWLLANNNQQCVVIDPGCASAVLVKLQTLNLIPIAILLTHHHYDHTDGVVALVDTYPELEVFGPEETRIKGAKTVVYDGNVVNVGDMSFTVLAVPGHTAGHVAYYCSPYLFCGDTLFSAGCGRLYSPEAAREMYDSLQYIARLPDETQICCAHEYTISNLMFAQHLWPSNMTIVNYRKKMEQFRAENRATLPSSLQVERLINPFLCCNNNELQKEIGFSSPSKALWEVFARLRQKKDNF